MSRLQGAEEPPAWRREGGGGGTGPPTSGWGLQCPHHVRMSSAARGSGTRPGTDLWWSSPWGQGLSCSGRTAFRSSSLPHLLRLGFHHLQLDKGPE